VRVVVDPGHGGHDTGAVANGVVERDYVLAVARELQAFCGWEATRGEEFVKLAERGVRSRNLGADLVLSLHVNANKDPKAKGLTCYALKAQPEALALGDLICQSAPPEFRRGRGSTIVAHNGPGTGDDWLQRPINVLTPHADHATVVLVELFFCTNPADAHAALNGGVPSLARSLQASVQTFYARSTG